jgi:hypothetical protein
MSKKEPTASTGDETGVTPETQPQDPEPFQAPPADEPGSQEPTQPQGPTEPEVGEQSDAEPVRKGDPGKLAAAAVDAYRSHPAK